MQVLEMQDQTNPVMLHWLALEGAAQTTSTPFGSSQ